MQLAPLPSKNVGQRVGVASGMILWSSCDNVFCSCVTSVASERYRWIPLTNKLSGPMTNESVKSDVWVTCSNVALTLRRANGSRDTTSDPLERWLSDDILGRYHQLPPTILSYLLFPDDYIWVSLLVHSNLDGTFIQLSARAPARIAGSWDERYHLGDTSQRMT